MSTIHIQSYLKICNVCIHTLVYKNTVFKLILAYNLSVKWNETGWYFWNEMFWHYQNETRKMKWFILTLSCGKFLQNRNVPVEQLNFNKTAFLELNSVLLKRFWAAVGGAYLRVSAFVNLPFSEMKATRHVKFTIHYGNWPWIMQFHLKPESHCDKTGSNHSVKYFDMCSPLTRLPHGTSTNMPPHRMIAGLGIFPTGIICASDVPERIIQMENLGVMAFPNSFTRTFNW